MSKIFISGLVNIESSLEIDDFPIEYSGPCFSLVFRGVHAWNVSKLFAGKNAHNRPNVDHINAFE